MQKIICPYCGAVNYTASPRCLSPCCKCGKEFAIEPRLDLPDEEREKRFREWEEKQKKEGQEQEE